jgi:hypothetical protein
MKKTTSIILLATITCLTIAYAYIKGHSDGVKDSEVRSLSLEYYIYDKLDRGDVNAGREQLAHLMAFRFQWLNGDISPLEGWSYWRHVKDWDECSEIQSNAEIIAKTSEELLKRDKVNKIIDNDGSIDYLQKHLESEQAAPSNR